MVAERSITQKTRTLCLCTCQDPSHQLPHALCSCRVVGGVQLGQTLLRFVTVAEKVECTDWGGGKLILLVSVYACACAHVHTCVCLNVCDSACVLVSVWICVWVCEFC